MLLSILETVVLLTFYVSILLHIISLVRILRLETVLMDLPLYLQPAHKNNANCDQSETFNPISCDRSEKFNLTSRWAGVSSGSYIIKKYKIYVYMISISGLYISRILIFSSSCVFFDV